MLTCGGHNNHYENIRRRRPRESTGAFPEIAQVRRRAGEIPRKTAA